MALSEPHDPVRLAARRLRWLLLGCGCMALLLLLRSQIHFIMVVGESMRPTLGTGDLLLVNKQAYRPAEPQRGDIVVARFQKGLIVKRIVGLPGEEVEVRAGTVSINGRPIAEAHAIEAGPLDIAKGRLATGKFAVLGDNRALPQFQVVHAVLSKEQIIGKVIYAVHWRSPVRGAPSTQRVSIPRADLRSLQQTDSYEQIK